MGKRLLILVIPVLMLAGTGRAAEKAKAVGQYVDLQPTALPIVVDGKLVNYVFVHVRMNLSNGADLIRLRTREPFFRDALVREGHRSSFLIAGDWQKVDELKLAAVMMRYGESIAGPGAVTSVAVTSQVPQRRLMPPRAAPAGPPATP